MTDNNERPQAPWLPPQTVAGEIIAQNVMSPPVVTSPPGRMSPAGLPPLPERAEDAPQQDQETEQESGVQDAESSEVLAQSTEWPIISPIDFRKFINDRTHFKGTTLNKKDHAVFDEVINTYGDLYKKAHDPEVKDEAANNAAEEYKQDVIEPRKAEVLSGFASQADGFIAAHDEDITQKAIETEQKLGLPGNNMSKNLRVTELSDNFTGMVRQAHGKAIEDISDDVSTVLDAHAVDPEQAITDEVKNWAADTYLHQLTNGTPAELVGPTLKSLLEAYHQASRPVGLGRVAISKLTKQEDRPRRTSANEVVDRTLQAAQNITAFLKGKNESIASDQQSVVTAWLKDTYPEPLQEDGLKPKLQEMLARAQDTVLPTALSDESIARLLIGGLNDRFTAHASIPKWEAPAAEEPAAPIAHEALSTEPSNDTLITGLLEAMGDDEKSMLILNQHIITFLNKTEASQATALMKRALAAASAAKSPTMKLALIKSHLGISD